MLPHKYCLYLCRYTVGLIVASFLFASLSGTISELRLVGVGMLLWACGCAATGLSTSYGGVILARVSVLTS